MSWGQFLNYAAMSFVGSIVFTINIAIIIIGYKLAVEA